MLHVNLPIQVSSINQTGAAVAESFFGPAIAEQSNTAVANQAQQSVGSFFHNFVL
jgi:hypothetical protein